MTQHSLDTVTLVTPEDVVLGSMDKIEAHRGDGKLHRAISIFLFRRKAQTAELLIQKRSALKIVGAGMWANTVCGNVRFGESYLECANRRLLEELGISETVALADVYPFVYHTRCNEHFSERELDHIFVGEADPQLKLNPDEVEETRWVEWHDLLAHWKEAAGDHCTLGQYQDIVLAPWFVMMLKEKKVLKLVNQWINNAVGM